MKLYKKIYLHEQFIIEFRFLLSHMFPWMNKFLITENMFLPRLVNRKAAGLRIVSSKAFKPWIRVVQKFSEGVSSSY